MSAAAPMLAGRRRRLAGLLAVLALGEAVLAVLFAAALGQVLAAAHAPLLPLLAAGGYAVMLAAGLLLARWAAEDFAQDFVSDCRAAIITDAAAKGDSDTRWLAVLVRLAQMLHAAPDTPEKPGA